MINTQARSAGAISYGDLASLNRITTSVVTAENISMLNRAKVNGNGAPGGAGASGSNTAPQMTVPALKNLIQKGQKVALDSGNSVKRLKVCLGWNVTNPACDADASAFILGANGKVPGDDWFVFYGQEHSPDGSVSFANAADTDRQYITINLETLNPNVSKIVFVLTINEAFEKALNFSMVKDAYIRILNADTGEELVSFLMTDYYDNVISMMIGEIYLHNGAWKCNAVGNGVAKDLAGLCELYGVQVS